MIEVKAHKSWRTFSWLDELKAEQKHAGEPYGIILARRPHHQGFIAIMDETTLSHLLNLAAGKEDA